jgi:hypothetical protein
MPKQKLSPEILTAAIEGFEHQKVRIDAQIAELRAMLSGGRTEPAATPAVPKGKRRKLSAAARKRIGDAQRKRWAASKKPATTSQPAASSEAPKRKMGAAGRKAISEATKKRWAAFHAAKTADKPKRTLMKTAAKKATAKAPVKVAPKRTAMKKTPKKVAKAAEDAATVTAQ